MHSAFLAHRSLHRRCPWSNIRQKHTEFPPFTPCPPPPPTPFSMLFATGVSSPRAPWASAAVGYQFLCSASECCWSCSPVLRLFRGQCPHVQFGALSSVPIFPVSGVPAGRARVHMPELGVRVTSRAPGGGGGGSGLVKRCALSWAIFPGVWGPVIEPFLEEQGIRPRGGGGSVPPRPLSHTSKPPPTLEPPPAQGLLSSSIPLGRWKIAPSGGRGRMRPGGGAGRKGCSCVRGPDVGRFVAQMFASYFHRNGGKRPQSTR